MSFSHTLRTGIRSLARSPGFLITAVLSLGLGVGATAAAFSVIDSVRFRSLPYPDGNRLVLLSETVVEAPNGAASKNSCQALCSVSYETFSTFLSQHRFQTLDLVAGYTSGGKALTTGDESILLQGGVASDRLFELLQVKPEVGRLITPDDNRLGVPLVVLISHGLWTSQFGRSPSIIGKTIKLSDSHYTVIGVMPPGFDFEVGSDFWLPSVPTLDPSTRPSIRSLTVVGRLAPGHTVEQVNAELAGIDPAVLVRSLPEGARIQLKLEAAPLRERYTAATQSRDLIFGAIVACVLLIACANLANLVLVRALHQQREFAVRAALGAKSFRLVRELLVQHGIVVALASVVGVAFAAWFVRMLHSVAVLQSLRPSGMDFGVDARVVGCVIVLALGTLVLLSFVPARMVAQASVQQVLRSGGTGSAGGRWGSRAQRAFVVAQVALAVVLLVGAGLMVETVLRLSRLDLGFEATHLVQSSPSYPHPWRVKEKYLPVTRQILTDMGQIPGVRAAALRAPAPLAPGGAPPAITLAGQANPLPKELVPAVAVAVSPSYFETLGIGRVRGRTFTEQDLEQAPAVAVVNEWAARKWWPGADPVGQMIRVDTLPGQGVTLTIVGVVRDNKAAQQNLLLSQDGPELYRPYEQAPSAFPVFVVRANGPAAALLRPVRQLLVRSVPDRPVFAQLMADQVDQQLSGVRINAYQILGFAVVGLALALIGIHGVLSYTVGRRTQEIGIRGALGASRGHLAATVLADAGWLIGVGVAVGLGAAVAGTKLLSGVLYGTDPGEPLVYLGVAVGVATVGLIASYFPARRAARVDPIVALRAS